MVFDVSLLLKDYVKLVKMYICRLAARYVTTMSDFLSAYHAMEYMYFVYHPGRLLYMRCNWSLLRVMQPASDIAGAYCDALTRGS
jgi:hypothetical protein